MAAPPDDYEPKLEVDLERAMRDQSRKAERIALALGIARSPEAQRILLELLDASLPAESSVEPSTASTDTHGLPPEPTRASFKSQDEFEEALASWRHFVRPVLRARRRAISNASKSHSASSNQSEHDA